MNPKKRSTHHPSALRLVTVVMLMLLLGGGIILADRAAPTHSDPSDDPGPTQDEGVFLPFIVHEQPPTPTPTATATSTPSPTPTLTPTPGPTVVTIPCDWLVDGPGSGDWLGCVEGGIYEMQRHSVSFTMVLCCSRGTLRYAFEADARLTQGEGEYSLGFDIIDIFDGGGYLFGVNPRNGTYSLLRIDGSDWKAGVPLIGWTESPHIRRDLEWNHLRVERNGPTISLFINGQFVASVEDSTYHENGRRLTLYVRNYHQPHSYMQFNNIRIYRWP